MFPGIQRDTKEWNDTYKIRAIVERAINHFKINMCIAGRKTRNHTTIFAKILLFKFFDIKSPFYRHNQNAGAGS